MSKTSEKFELSWWGLRYLSRSAIVGVVFFILFWGFAKRVEPPVGVVFERLPPIAGIYKCCGGRGRYSDSYVSGISINCRTIGYYQFLGTNRNDCGLKAELNEQPVEIIRANIPSLGKRSPLVVQISSNGKIFYERTDARLRELWIWSTKSQSITMGFILAVIFHTAQLILINRKSNFERR